VSSLVSVAWEFLDPSFLPPLSIRQAIPEDEHSEDHDIQYHQQDDYADQQVIGLHRYHLFVYTGIWIPDFVLRGWSDNNIELDSTQRERRHAYDLKESIAMADKT